MPTDCLKLLHANFCNVKRKKKKNLGDYAAESPRCQTIKTNKIMRTVKLTLKEEVEIISAIEKHMEMWGEDSPMYKVCESILKKLEG